MRNALSGFLRVGEHCVVKVEALAVEKAFDAEALFDVVHQFVATLVWSICDRTPDESVGAIDERESGEDSGGLAELYVHAGNATAFDSIVHAGQVVEDERSGVEVF